ncbi:MAG: HAMP domain-containing histidine kinase [bacterium]|nr:HAMP domain-containing histidine kinase [bacterium]
MTENTNQSSDILKLRNKIKELSQENKELKQLIKNEIDHKSSTAQALHFQHLKEDALINSVPWMVFWVTKDLHYFDANQYFADKINIDIKLIVDKKVGTINESQELVDTLISFNESSDKTRVKEIKFISPNSDTYYLCIMHNNFELGHFSFVGIDITERKIINKLLEIKSKELEKILYISSHDLKSPILSISSLLNWLEEDLIDKLNNETEHLFSLLKNRVHRMDDILNSLLKYHSIKRGRYTISEINLESAIISLFKKITADNKSAKLLLSSDFPLIKTPGEALMFIIEALISNSIKHNNEQKITIEISLKKLPDYYSFTFKDNGCGIPVKFHSKVFDAFQTLKTKDEVEGCGMGLTIAKKIIETYKGKIFINTKFVSGTEISFTWPISINS